MRDINQLADIGKQLLLQKKHKRGLLASDLEQLQAIRKADPADGFYKAIAAAFYMGIAIGHKIRD